jgi:hypothetical protein
VTTLSDRLSARKMPHKDVSICLNLDLLEQRDEAMRKVRPSDVQDDRMVSAPANAKALVAELEQQIQDESITLRIRGVDRLTYNRWLVECPPRKGKQEPYDPTKFFMHAAKNSAVYVDENGVEQDISAEDWATIDKMLTDGEHDRVAKAVIHVNRAAGAVDVSFFANGSETTRDSFGISASRETSESLRVDSGAGNRKSSTSKKSTKKGAASSE